MLLSTTETIQGKTIVKHLGLVRGNTIRAGTSARTSWRAFATSSEAR